MINELDQTAMKRCPCAAAETSRTGKRSLQLILTVLFLAIKATLKYKSNTTASGYHHLEQKVDRFPQQVYFKGENKNNVLTLINNEERASLPLSSPLPTPSLVSEEKLYIPSSRSRSDDKIKRLNEQTQEHRTQSSFRKRSLRKNANDSQREHFRKGHNIDDVHFPASMKKRHRILIICSHDQTQDQCHSQFLSMYGNIPIERSGNNRNGLSNSYRNVKVVRNLESVRALSVEIDAQTLAKVHIDNEFVFYLDFLRRPLVVAGSIREYIPSRKDNENRNLQENSQKVPWGLEAIHAQDVWQDYDVHGEGVKICILDTGVQASHEDFRQSNLDGFYGNEFVSPHWYEDNSGHGTHIIGTVTASNNTIGVVGIAPAAETFVVRVFDDGKRLYDFADGTTFSTDLIAAASICNEWGANIISASLGGSNYNEIEEKFFKELFYKSGIFTVAAAGNGGNTNNVYPAAYDGVLSVGAVDESLSLANFSTFNPITTDVLAPGVNILSTFRGNKYATLSGTSMAVPHVTGTLALMLSYVLKTGITPDVGDILNALKHSTALTANITVNHEYSIDEAEPSSIGVIDSYAAIQYLAGDRRVPENRGSFLSRRKDSDPNDVVICNNLIHLDIFTDSKGNETHYCLKRLSDDQMIWSTGPNMLENYSKYSESSCLEVDKYCYQFVVRDVGGDGISEGGGIVVFFRGNEVYRGGDYGRGGILMFGNC